MTGFECVCVCVCMLGGGVKVGTGGLMLVSLLTGIVRVVPLVLDGRGAVLWGRAPIFSELCRRSLAAVVVDCWRRE
jgi:uncharacterized membrane protein YbhN (UPF0104 family)